MGLFRHKTPPASSPPGSSPEAGSGPTASTTSLENRAAVNAPTPTVPPAGPGTNPTQQPPAQSEPSEAQAILRELVDKIGRIAGTAEQEKDAMKKFVDKVDKMEDRLEMFQVLFESLSLKYNPFLGKQEAPAFDGRHPLPDLDQRHHGATPPEVHFAIPSQPVAGDDRSPSPNVVPVGPQVPAGPGPTDAGAPDGQPVVTGLNLSPPAGDYSRPPPAFTAANPTNVPHILGQANPGMDLGPAPGASREWTPPNPSSRALGPRAVPMTNAPLPGARESYLALCWLEHAYRALDGPGIQRLLDGYLELGWITGETHAWLRFLAYTVAPAPEKALEEGMPQAKTMTPLQATRLHKVSLRFFDQLFRFNLGLGEVRHLRREVSALVREG